MPCNIPIQPPKSFPWIRTWIHPSYGTSNIDLQTWIVIGQPLSSGQDNQAFSHAPSLPSTNGSPTWWWFLLKNDFYANKVSQDRLPSSLTNKSSCVDGPKTQN
eukprot:scaffold64915_cov45-Attheya_sp.AAC.2